MTTPRPQPSRTKVQRLLHEKACHAWLATRTWAARHLTSFSATVDGMLGISPLRETFDEVDRASDESFPASDPPSHSAAPSR